MKIKGKSKQSKSEQYEKNKRANAALKKRQEKNELNISTNNVS